MIYKQYKNIKLSCLGMGNMRLPQIGKPGSGDKIDYVKAHEILDKALASGINYYDTAHVYNGGDSESCLGEWIAKQDRDSFYVATKFNIGACKDYKGMFEAQLKRLQTERIDFYLIHCILDGNIDEYINSGAIEYFEEQKRKGRITYLGFSSHASPATLKRFADLREWDFAQIQLNYYDWLYETTKEEYEILYSRNIPIVVMEPVRGGKLADLTPVPAGILKNAHPEWTNASWALRFVKSLPGVQVILSGMSTMEQLENNLETFSVENDFTEADKEVLFNAGRALRNDLYVPCTACRYCTDNCPMQINIPEYLKFLNAYKIEGKWGLQGIENVDSQGTPSDCIACGACMTHCPQGIEIPKFMSELAEVM